MSDFNGLVKAKRQDLEKALHNWKEAYSAAKRVRSELIERSKQETITTKFLWVFSDTRSKYDYIKSEVGFGGSYWTFSSGLKDIYPDVFTAHVAGILDNGRYFDDIEAMLNLNPEEVYLSSEQAAKVVKWRDYE
jgi:hypothetical protein